MGFFHADCGGCIASACVLLCCTHACKLMHVPVTELHTDLDQPAHGQHRADDATSKLEVECEHGDHPRIVRIFPLQLSASCAQVLRNIGLFGLPH